MFVMISGIVVFAVCALLMLGYYLRDTGAHNVNNRSRALGRPPCGVDERYVTELRDMNADCVAGDAILGIRGKS